ncbi:MAG: efflux RND transporter periplasmic adaptor subunit, partial [Isosphaeraceae bacterium]
RVTRARGWRDLARTDLDRARLSLQGDLAEIEAQIQQHRAEVERAGEVLQRDRKLLARGALQTDVFRETEKACRVAQAMLNQAEARKGARTAEGTLKAEAELARRQTELADAEAALRLLEAGTRPEELEAEHARRARLEEELRYLLQLQARLDVNTPIGGQIVTTRLRERVGQFLQEGDLIAEVETPHRVEVEVALSEQEVARVRPGQTVEMKVRALPFQTFRTRVDRVSPAARTAPPASPHGGARGQEAAASVVPLPRDLPGTFVAYGVLEDQSGELKTGMTGHARVLLGPTPIGRFLLTRALRLVRTEFWW